MQIDKFVSYLITNHVWQTRLYASKLMKLITNIKEAVIINRYYVLVIILSNQVGNT